MRKCPATTPSRKPLVATKTKNKKMNIIEDASQIRELVKENELEQSLNRLFELTERSRKQDEVAVMSA